LVRELAQTPEKTEQQELMTQVLSAYATMASKNKSHVEKARDELLQLAQKVCARSSSSPSAAAPDIRAGDPRRGQRIHPAEPNAQSQERAQVSPAPSCRFAVGLGCHLVVRTDAWPR
jgi:hypothetical protein